MSTKRKNLKIASALRPQDFGPQSLYGIPHIRTRAIRDYEMEHFIRFIRNSGGGNFPRVQRKDNLKIASLSDKADSSIMNYVTEKGFFLDGQGGSLCNRAVIFMMLGSTTLTYMDYLYL